MSTLGQVLLLCMAAASMSSQARTLGVKYRSIMGDPGMKWGPQPASLATALTDAASSPQGPRMQLFFYVSAHQWFCSHHSTCCSHHSAPLHAADRAVFQNLCSKAGPSNYSVIPAFTDSCATAPDGVQLGIGEVARVISDECCSACLNRTWCLAWTEPSKGACSLKDNTIRHPPTPPPNPADFETKPGNCGQTSWNDQCSDSSTSGAIHAKASSITTMAACKAFCSQCDACNFVSFSADHDDCSWYSSCDIQHLATTAGNYSSTQIKNLTALPSGFRQYQPAQELPSPRDANCLVDAKQTVTQQDNAAQVPVGLDEEWFAVLKEHQLAEKCSERAPRPPPPRRVISGR